MEIVDRRGALCRAPFCPPAEAGTDVTRLGNGGVEFWPQATAVGGFGVAVQGQGGAADLASAVSVLECRAGGHSL